MPVPLSLPFLSGKAMKTIAIISLLFGLAMPALNHGPAAPSLAVNGSTFWSSHEARQEEGLIRGIVKERKEDWLVVVDRIDESKENRVQLTGRTKYLKDGREITADEVPLGAPVAVRTRQDAERKLEALEVRVIRALVGVTAAVFYHCQSS
jgi:hypothetical protein